MVAHRRIGEDLETLRLEMKRRGLLLESERPVCEELIGKGGSGEVFRGILNGTEAVAVKRYLPGKLDMLEREVDLMDRVNHRNVLRVRGVVERNESLDLVMPFATNGDLWTAIHSRKLFETTTSKMKLVLGIAKGLECLHKHGIIHGDLKPENILLDDNLSPVISDFGLARLRRHSASFDGKCAGTFRYMAPEIVRKLPCTEKSDMYSFGVLVCELFTGRIPFGDNGMSRRVALAACSKGLRPNVHGIRSPVILGVIEACWRSDASKRPSWRWVFRELSKANEPTPVTRLWPSGLRRSTTKVLA
eukprot:Plantae.Rhodophyta-Purpureofilum_apyrenoidigerum.ctg7552.p1 GENE.Plantae.Rhodophyta-Purpureofilum_apyrenoidigerum.ctg7552~~Plantae.Rhodophyta-Purpureofilum_apyrenoidigerum.ctg7552.p1  ORF type:complete len:329 (-),score=24.81 Plantae.Rhodophyta-Purpureofilum_apyrenoidigerum.ctg7552:171-1082(-)